MAERQQILQLWLTAATLDAEVAAWSFHDGADGFGAPGLPGEPGQRPYRTGVDALTDGWFLVQAPGPIDPAATNGELSCAYLFERRVDVSYGPGATVD